MNNNELTSIAWNAGFFDDDDDEPEICSFCKKRQMADHSCATTCGDLECEKKCDIELKEYRKEKAENAIEKKKRKKESNAKSFRAFKFLLLASIVGYLLVKIWSFLFILCASL